MKYRKKPVVIEAYQWHGERTGSRGVEFIKWIKSLNGTRDVTFNDDKTLTIKTLEGDHLAQVNDFIISGVKGELYPCKPDIFEMTYEKYETQEN